jgi:hypothetical protein
VTMHPPERAGKSCRPEKSPGLRTRRHGSDAGRVSLRLSGLSWCRMARWVLAGLEPDEAVPRAGRDGRLSDYPVTEVDHIRLEGPALDKAEVVPTAAVAVAPVWGRR